MMNEPATYDKFWSKVLSAHQRSIEQYRAIMLSANGDRLESANLLWKRSRHDSALQEDLVKTACSLISLASACFDGHSHETPIPLPPGRSGPVSKFDRDPEVAAFVKERLGKVPLRKIAAEAKQRFGKDRVPGKSAIHAYWQRLAGAKIGLN